VSSDRVGTFVGTVAGNPDITEANPKVQTSATLGACYCFRRPAFRPQSLSINIPVFRQSLNCDPQRWTQLLICLPLHLRMQSDLA